MIKPGSVEQSELFARISLPATDAKAMPPEGKTLLRPDDVTVIRLWIAAGASGTQAVEAIQGAPKALAQIRFTEIDEAAVERARAPLASQVRQLQARFPNVIAYESRGSADLQVNASLLRASFGDAELAALAPLSDHIVWADFSGTSVSDAAAKTIGAMKHLRVLRLMNTDATDTMIQALASLSSLRSLTVVESSVSVQSLRPLLSKGVKIYDENDAQDRSDGK